MPPSALERLALDNIRYCTDLEYLAFKHYLSTSWSFKNVSIEGFMPVKVPTRPFIPDTNADKLISYIDHLTDSFQPGFLCTDN